jgi:uncharacterized protein YutE (UPF0331/DUF86 family)
MLDKALVRQKLAFLLEHLDELEPLTAITLDEYRADVIKRHATEKLIELVVGYATDVNQLVIEGAGRAAPQSYYNSFTLLAELNVLPRDLATRLANTTGLRNRLVHLYEKLSHESVFYSLVPLVKNYRQYLVLINGYLHTLSDEEK